MIVLINQLNLEKLKYKNLFLCHGIKKEQNIMGHISNLNGLTMSRAKRYIIMALKLAGALQRQDGISWAYGTRTLPCAHSPVAKWQALPKLALIICSHHVDHDIFVYTVYWSSRFRFERCLLDVWERLYIYSSHNTSIFSV